MFDLTRLKPIRGPSLTYRGPHRPSLGNIFNGVHYRLCCLSMFSRQWRTRRRWKRRTTSMLGLCARLIEWSLDSTGSRFQNRRWQACVSVGDDEPQSCQSSAQVGCHSLRLDEAASILCLLTVQARCESSLPSSYQVRLCTKKYQHRV